MGALFMEGVKQLAQKHPCIQAVRGVGLMIGVVLNIPAKPVEAKLRENGLLCIATGDHVLRFVPPLVVTPAQIRQALAMIDQAL